MMEDGRAAPAAPECKVSNHLILSSYLIILSYHLILSYNKDGLGWVYYSGHCYMFTSYHVDFLIAEELCNEAGAYLADILDAEEANFIKGVLNAVNPKDGTDYWIGGMDIDRDKTLQWLTGAEMVFRDFKNNEEPAGSPFLHMNFDDQFRWDTKDDANDKDNGFICKKAHQ